jgi:hypothetical protein
MSKIAFIASIPDRVEMLKETVRSLLPQVDEIYLSLNNYSATEGMCIKAMDVDRIHIEFLDNKLGDSSKFYFTRKLKDVYAFICDDDMAYPQNYVSYMISKIEEYKRKAVVSLHGRTLNLPITAYYSGANKQYIFTKEVKQDVPVHVIGTGCMAYHSDTIQVSIDNFPSKNMADVHFSVAAHKKGIPLIVVKHRENWIPYMAPENTIYKEMCNNDSEQVSRLKKIEYLLK